ncbi:Histone deacetylation protein Rxt3 family protein [Candida parapsilosis]|uniref:Histone deacetylation protein Rxt3 family protein n=1 Tax=Candida parapsilosis TaxID=5480 RepID=A0A8X7NSN0_CANPA|nr:Histone deacetylation protein Rxt3 family protein [Candida parapsilosis]KAF6056424.1 Histone deacetylation protein Rxt3 family protein [Candida parapsilosis]KAF6059358.1 Histone deacetylation protein Rxt3 family protein [Candida parapsilosis]KAF6068114.1 Histone deacetylation protein Rxt3 family protein [Candida parapsilosis]KAI5905251.1 hypothetical protein K4G60_g4509 [Candida parapsilosis]
MSTQPNTQFSSSSTAANPVTPSEGLQQPSSSQLQRQPEQQSLPNLNNHHHHHHHHHTHPHHHHHHHLDPHHHHHIIDNSNHHLHHHANELENNSRNPNPVSNEMSQQQQQQQLVKSLSDTSDNKDGSSNTALSAISSKRSKPKLNIEPIELIIKELFPHRRFLGTIIYNPTTTWETLQTRTLYGLKPSLISRFDEIKKAYKQQMKINRLPTRYIPVVPPLPQEYINSVIDVKIPFRYIVEFKQDFYNEIVSRELWGGASGVYTDDSDILQVLLHMGFFNDSIDLSTWNKKWEKRDILRPINLLNQSVKDSNSPENNNENGNKTDSHRQLTATTPQPIDQDIYGDLSVQILLLPSLPSYYGFFANGINSRSWNLTQSTNSQHTGLSFAVYNVKWEERGSYLHERILMHGVEFENEVDYELNHESMRAKGGWQFDYDAYKKIKESIKAQSSEG